MTGKRYSLRYWVKNSVDMWTFSERYPQIVEQYVAHHANGGIPNLDYSGDPQQFALDLYAEAKRKARIYNGAFLTPLDAATRLVNLLVAEIGSGKMILDPACGTGNLLWAAKQAGCLGVGVELQRDFACTASALGHAVHLGDFLAVRPGQIPLIASARGIVMNPPFGKMQGFGDVATAFVEKAQGYGVPVAAILPSGWWDKSGKAYDQARRGYHLLHREALPADTFKPLTSVMTEMVLLQPEAEA